jgi:putative tricarboxylic transport membrane protein
MLEAFFEGLLVTLAWQNLQFLIIGVAIGFVVGVIPGLGGPVAIALMLPFTFDMGPEAAFAFLLGMLAVTATTGELTSILFGVPGEATAAALVLDGHAMAKNGEVGRAVGASLMSSLVGAWLGAMFLAMAIPVVRPLVLSFGSPEFFMLTVLGITFVAILGTGSMLKALIAGAFGLLIAMIGLDPLTATQRYTFGVLHLWDGVGIVPAAIGLFAIPEIVELASRGTSISKEGAAPAVLNGLMRGVKDTFKHWWLVVRCSAIGAFIGVLPGLGGSVAQWVTYGHAVQTSKDPSRFGKGAIEGILAPGSANNSKEGGSIIPTVAFGIPGSTSMALLLGAFVIQGLAPGPRMLTTHLTLTMSFVWTIVVANLIAVVASVLLIRQIVKLTQVRGSRILGVIVIMVLIGSFAAKNSFLDILVMLAFGALGCAMVAYNWPRAPLILGLVLGNVAENYMFLAVSRYGWSWLSHPLVMVIGGITLLGVILQARREILRRQEHRAPKAPRAEPKS